MDPESPLLVLLLPVLYLFGGCLTLLQFQVAYTLVVQVGRQTAAADQIRNNALTRKRLACAGLLQNLSDYLIRVFGQPHKFVPQPTHVVLVALMIAVIVHLERVRRACATVARA
ncbi:uncharacterized protein HaLaN_09252, partial [Haematococcus lacustris]